MEEIRRRLEQVQDRIARAAQRAGRDPAEITLLGASKTIAPERIKAAIELGLGHVGENRAQEAEEKQAQVPSLRDAATWHMIGSLQTNKARRALELFDVVQSVDRARLVHQLDRLAREAGRVLPVYAEINLAGEATKTGVSAGELPALAETISGCRNLRLDGLMAVPPAAEDVEATRPYFRQLRELLDRLNDLRLFSHRIAGLSMGMTHDFEVAIEEGSTMVRLGTALFGARPA